MSGKSLSSLEAMVAAELAAPAAVPVTAIAEAARATQGRAVCAVLFYGSCRRDGYGDGQLVDLYLLVDDYATVHASVAMRWLNRLVPPNVYYLEADHAGGRVRAKYALVSLDQFERRMGAATLNPYFWARFAQPTGLLWSRDRVVADRVRAALAHAIRTTAEAVRPLVGEKADAATLWTRALTESYRTELRAEKPERARSIVAGDLDRYRRVTTALGPPTPFGSPRRREAALALAADPGQGPEHPPTGQGVVHFRRRRRLPRVENQPTRRRARGVPAMGAPPSHAGGPSGAAGG